MHAMLLKELNKMPSRNQLLVPGVEQMLEQFKAEIAQEFGVHLGSDTKARANGSVGGEMTKRLVAQAQAQLNNTK
jgi:small acid-soluble spore protein D (minor alpha/beta-type SASP)